MLIQDITVRLGETWAIACSFHDASGAPLDMTNGHVAIRVRDTLGNSFDYSDSGGFTFNDTSSGTWKVEKAQQTGYTPAARYTYEIQVTTANGLVSDQAFGRFVVDGSLFG